MSLEDIFRKHGTDKVDMHHYAPHYERHLWHLQNDHIDLLEIGVGLGQSLTAWQEYFPHANICALDIEPKELPFTVYQGHQAEVLTLAEMIKFHEEGFDVIIDDGSHRGEDVIPTFMMLWKYLKSNGVYVIEDTQTSYWPSFAGSVQPGPLTAMGFLKELIDGLNWEERDQPWYSPTRFDREILGISFYHNIVFIQKGNNQEGSNLMFHNTCPWGSK
jgi:hypothetical protein